MIDADTYEEVFVFDTFFGEVWSLAVSSIGDYFVAVSADKGIRVWRQTNEQAFVSDEQDYRQEKQMLREAVQEFAEVDFGQAAQLDPFAKDKVVKIETGEAAKRTVESIKYGDELMFALELADEFKTEVDSYGISLELYRSKKGPKPERPEPSIHFMGRNIFDHVLIRLKAIRSSDLESTLKFLNYKFAISLLFYVEHYLRNVSTTPCHKPNFLLTYLSYFQKIDLELATRTALYLIKSYEIQITSQVDQMRPLLQSIAMHLKHHFMADRETIGVNMAALSILQKQLAELQNNDFEGLFGKKAAISSDPFHE